MPSQHRGHDKLSPLRTQFLERASLRPLGGDTNTHSWGSMTVHVAAPHDHVDDEPSGGLRRKDVGAARDIPDDVVLGGATEFCRRNALFSSIRDVQRKKPCSGGVDRHRSIHLARRDAVEQRSHMAKVGDGDTFRLHLSTVRHQGRNRFVSEGRRRGESVWPFARLVRQSSFDARAVSDLNRCASSMAYLAYRGSSLRRLVVILAAVRRNRIFEQF